MAWDVDDVARSIRRYLSLTLASPPWRLRVERRIVNDDDRPVAVVDVGPQVVTFARETRHQGEWQYVAPVTITAYPEMDTDERASAHAARLLRAQFIRLIVNGVIVTDPGGRAWSGPLRLPLWDYSQTDLSGPDKAGPEIPHDVMFVQRESVTAEAIQDTEDPKRWTVVLEFQASVEAPGAQPEPGVPVASISGDFIA